MGSGCLWRSRCAPCLFCCAGVLVPLCVVYLYIYARFCVCLLAISIVWICAGGTDFDQCIEFLKSKFLSVVPETAVIYPHVTCGISTDNVRAVWRASKDIILTSNMALAGL